MYILCKNIYCPNTFLCLIIKSTVYMPVKGVKQKNMALCSKYFSFFPQVLDVVELRATHSNRPLHKSVHIKNIE